LDLFERDQDRKQRQLEQSQRYDWDAQRLFAAEQRQDARMEAAEQRQDARFRQQNQLWKRNQEAMNQRDELRAGRDGLRRIAHSLPSVPQDTDANTRKWLSEMRAGAAAMAEKVDFGDSQQIGDFHGLIEQYNEALKVLPKRPVDEGWEYMTHDMKPATRDTPDAKPYIRDSSGVMRPAVDTSAERATDKAKQAQDAASDRAFRAADEKYKTALEGLIASGLKDGKTIEEAKSFADEVMKASGRTQPVMPATSGGGGAGIPRTVVGPDGVAIIPGNSTAPARQTAPVIPASGGDAIINDEGAMVGTQAAAAPPVQSQPPVVTYVPPPTVASSTPMEHQTIPQDDVFGRSQQLAANRAAYLSRAQDRESAKRKGVLPISERQALIQEREAAKSRGVRSRSGLVRTTSGTSTGGVVQISTDAEFNQLPSGTFFIGPDGQPRRKP
jgi:hypothetical protein